MIDIVARESSRTPTGEGRSPAASWASSPRARATMLANRSRDTGPELAVRRLLHAEGFRYRVNFAPLPNRRRVTADIVFTRQRVVILIDGCFWHGCPEHYVESKTNVEYWRSKITANKNRDAEVTRALTSDGWQVLRFWEHEPASAIRDSVVAAIRGASQTNARGV